jgi:hypothetical protein
VVNETDWLPTHSIFHVPLGCIILLNNSFKNFNFSIDTFGVFELQLSLLSNPPEGHVHSSRANMYGAHMPCAYVHWMIIA